MDIVQGGMFNVQSTIKTQFSDGLRSAKVKNQNWSMMDNHCFIPTVSALGFKNPSFHWNAAINTRNLVQTGEIPFDNYYIPSHNQDHVSLTKESVAWVMGQLNGNYYNQTGEFVITGPTTVCDQATFTINNLPPGATVQWSTSNNNLTIVSSEGNTATFGKNGNGECIIQCSIIVGATNFTITHSVWSGIPPIPIKILGLSKLAINSQYSFTVATNNLSPIDYFEWTLGGKKNVAEIFSGQGTENISIVTGNSGGILKISVKVRNSCGTSSTYSISATVDEGLGWLSIIPNPATDIFTVELHEKQPENTSLSAQRTTKTSRTGTYEIQLWSASSMVRRFTTDQPMYQISVSGLPAGFYFVRVIKDGETYTKKLIKR